VTAWSIILEKNKSSCVSLERENRKEHVWSIILERIRHPTHWCSSIGQVKQLVKRKERKDVAFEKHTSIVTCFKGFWGVIGTKSHCVLLGRLSNRGRRPQWRSCIYDITSCIITCQYRRLWYSIHATIWVCTNHASLRFIAFHHVSMHDVVKEDCMLLWILFILYVNHIAPVRQSQSIHAPRFLLRMGPCFLLRMGLAYLHFFKSVRHQAKALLLMGTSIALQRFSDSVLSPAARGSADFSSPTHCRCSLGFQTRVAL
jgi:hypothetical protein